MNVNSTQETLTGSTGTHSLALDIGLPLFFLLLVIVAGVLLYKYQDKVRNVVASARSESQRKKKKKTRDNSPHRASVSSEHSASHIPIYENVTSQKPAVSSREAETHRRLLSEPEEDLYLQCDVQDDAIYSNDPQCNLVIIQNSKDEDVYIIPDS